MSLNEFVKIVETKVQNNTQDNYQPEELLSLSGHLENDVREAKFSYRNKTVLVRGIPEDFKIFLDNELVCECVYDTIYKDNRKLVEFLLEKIFI